MAPPPALELEIRNMLLGKTSARDILDYLVPRFYDPQFSAEDRRILLAFAWNSGLYQQALDYFPDLLSKRQLIPWAWFAELLAKAKVPAAPELIESLLKGSRRQGQGLDLTLSRSWDAKIPEIARWRLDAETERKEKFAHQRQVLLEKLDFFRNEQLAEEERRLLQLLKKMFPDDRELAAREIEFAERWARHVISTHSSDAAGRNETTELMWGPEVLAAVAPMVNELKEIAAKRPELTHEFAVALLVMDLDSQAEDFLSVAAADPASDWLRAEVLLRSRRYVDCLDHLTALETKYAGDPETAFSVTYLRAQAFWYLGQPGRAIELIQTLVNIRPNYRSAASLLKQWQTGRPA
jgi:hypothetical protein